jgi:hypothetical protein
MVPVLKAKLWYENELASARYVACLPCNQDVFSGTADIVDTMKINVNRNNNNDFIFNSPYNIQLREIRHIDFRNRITTISWYQGNCN